MTPLAILNSSLLVLILFILHDLRDRAMRIEGPHMNQPTTTREARR